MAWFKKEKYTTLKPPVMKDRIPEGLWTKCENCFNLVLTKDFEENLKVCKKCNHHHRMTARERVAMLADEGTFREMFTNVQPTDPLGFVDSKPYHERLKAAQKASGHDEAVMVGTAEIDGIAVGLGVMVFEFVGGSMGSVVGERIARLIEYCSDHLLPLVIVSASGGARMQEGILSLMQMAKTSGALARLAEKKVPYISVLTNPTTAGVMASYASLGDVIIAEPDALIGFAGPRVIQQTINQILPKGFQKSEFVLEHGFLDKVVHRKELKKTIAMFLHYFTGQNPRSWSAEGTAEATENSIPA
ncbi:MAG: acetyl-CoA carboxylase, carboxyltransferase subunit beta [Candidatus Sumerlaeaceae bacterium]|jgi:acetyl-CoA carboxylase carboxyl transferase subunit beta